MSEKIQKVLSSLGIGSRRKIEQWIKENRITVDGLSAHLGQRITTENKVCLDNKQLDLTAPQSTTRVLIYNKPLGEICTRDDPEGRKTIFQNLPNINNGRWISVGRLDINTSGLILLTNNGELANRLMHPSYEVQRQYIVCINKKLSNDEMKNIQQGIMLDDGIAHVDEIKLLDQINNKVRYKLSLHEGRYREIRRVFQAMEHKVISLKRISYANISLPIHLEKRKYVDLDSNSLTKLLKLVKLY